MASEKKLTRAEQKVLRPLQILDAALEEFVARGFSAARVEDIAERVGVTKGTVYVYFDTKEALFEAMIDHISAPFAEVVERLQELTGSPKERLVELLRLVYDHLVEDRRARELLRFVVSEGSRFPNLIDRHHNEFIAPMVGHLQSILADGIKAKEFREQPAEYAEVVISPVIAMTVLRLIFEDRRPLDRSRFLQTHLALVLNGILSQGTAAAIPQASDDLRHLDPSAPAR